MSHFTEPAVVKHLLAKSTDRSAGSEPESLAEHTYRVLEKIAEIAHMRPHLPQIVGQPDLWHVLYWTCFLHDFGKASDGFQHMLRTKERWPHRHEVVSLAFVDWITSDLAKDQCSWIVAAIASHHRDAVSIQRDYADEETLADAWASLNSTTISCLWQWLSDYGARWIIDLGLDHYGVRPLQIRAHDDALAILTSNGCQRIRHWLDTYEQLLDQMDSSQPSVIATLIIVRGLTITADHMASAHLVTIPAPIQEHWKSLAYRILQGRYTPYIHQETSARMQGQSVVLVAPTGSGKTEAAMYWALGDGQQPVPRLFYVLPYQASMNAMFDRLRRQDTGFGPEAVGLQHGRALQALYSRLLTADTGITTQVAAAQEKWQRNINSLHARPLKVFSPYQMLKSMFQLKGFEAMLSDYAQASFIFDEIHAYEPTRLALILALVGYLREHFAARFFIMSATFPGIIRKHLAETLGTFITIQADEGVFAHFRRHRLHLLDGELTDQGSITQIVADVKVGKQVLVCANTVKRSQQIHHALIAAGLLPQQVMLIHSRYIIKHRNEREEIIMRRCGIAARTHEPLVLVATQVVEVSLNIDLDVIYTDPAPLEALLQRFGRVNRSCTKGICPVYVFRQPDNGQFVYGRNSDPSKQGHIIRVTLDELAKHDGVDIDESAITTWLDTIYTDPYLNQEWEDAYHNVAPFAHQVLSQLRPFNSDAQTTRRFEELFDNVDVLPACFEQTYIQLIHQQEYVEASRYFVGISQKKYHQLASQGFIRALDDDTTKQQRWIVRLPYTEETGLAFETQTHDPDWD